MRGCVICIHITDIANDSAELRSCEKNEKDAVQAWLLRKGDCRDIKSVQTSRLDGNNLRAKTYERNANQRLLKKKMPCEESAAKLSCKGTIYVSIDNFQCLSENDRMYIREIARTAVLPG